MTELALDVRWTLSRDADKLWRKLNPELWERTQNPWAVLQTVSGENLKRITSEPAFRATLDEIMQARAADNDSTHWFQTKYSNSSLKCAAYFSMEYMLGEALPIYSGGLGNVAGDQLKAANDLGVPVVAVGLLYSQGYFRQEIDKNGVQHALYPFNDPGQLPVSPVRDANGDWLRLAIPFPGTDIRVRAWEVHVGRARLLLLDTNDPVNIPEYRGITSELYGGGPELRLRQEHVLGIGGWRLLRALSIQPEVCHLNEGHAAFAVLERAASFKDDTGSDFHVALTATRAGNLFTTHTAVEAGFDRFPVDLMRTHFERYCGERLGIGFDEFMSLGRRNPYDAGEPFNMAYLAIRGSGAVNGVSRLHGAVSRSLFEPLFPRWPAAEVPVGYVTNGVHMPTWDSDAAFQMWTEVCGAGCWHGDLEGVEARLRATSDMPIWNMRTVARKSMIDYMRPRYSQQVGVSGGSSEEIEEAARILDPDALTLGFARRFATYKRPNLLLHDPDRLKRILTNRERRVQLVLAGKAHPADGAGQELIRQWNEFIRHSGLHSSVVFLSDYDMLLTERMVGGVDVWINTPRRPWEASGTSGMKVLVNGGLNLSELDGWWAEAYAPEVGWAIGDGREHGDDPAWDAAEAEAVYTLLEQHIIPEFYQRNAAGIPERWVARIRESMARLTPQYSANRAVRQYTEEHYVPAASAYAARIAQGGKLAREILLWEQNLARNWSGISFGALKAESKNGAMHIEVAVHLGGLDPGMVQVELFAEGSEGPVRKVMERNESIYRATVEGNRPASDFTPRLVPYHPSASVPLEAGEILWQK
ncbi:MAG TPA: alpha-glucan family phosphorylase [Bryobacteraceae bacterium]|nr:alpha-glucan family phosphorylase [Bryobacteraceae bacterium]